MEEQDMCENPACADYEKRVSRTVECDVVVVGAGPSGITACLQAAELGLMTVIIETTGRFGGNGTEVEGIFAVGSKMQKELGIDVTFREVIESECKMFNYHINALAWQDLVRNSAGNIDWLLSHGVGLSGVVDECKGDGEVNVFHWFKRRQPDNRGDGSQLTRPLLEDAVKLGAQAIPNTRGMELIMKDGKVAGLYAVNTETDEVTRFDCKAVILATGGFSDSEEMMAERGFDTKHLFHRGYPGHYGDGVRMAASAGAEDVSRVRTYLIKLHIDPLFFYSQTIMYIHQKGLTLWVNGNGERYANELCGEHVAAFFTNAKMSQEKTFSVFDTAFIERNRVNAPDIDKDLEDLLNGDGNNVFRADTIEELAEKVGMDPTILSANVARYNELCAKGCDDDFAKPADHMIPIDKAPFYIVRQDMAVWTSIGGVRTNRKFEAVKPDGKPVPGLYAVGVEGCELYRDGYTMNMPGSCNGNSVNSGRTAAKSAFAYIKGE